MNFYQPPFYQPPVQQPFYQPPLMQPIMPFDPMMQPEYQALNQQSYIENILRLNLGKVATVYMNFENSQWSSKIFKGILQAAGKDHIVIKDQQTETRYLLLSIYLNYITFDEVIEYEYPYHNQKK